MGSIEQSMGEKLFEDFLQEQIEQAETELAVMGLKCKASQNDVVPDYGIAGQIHAQRFYIRVLGRARSDYLSGTPIKIPGRVHIYEPAT